MKIHGIGKVQQFAAEHADAHDRLAEWIREVTAATWKTPAEIKNRYASASFLSNNIVIWNIKGNSYRLAARVSFSLGLVTVEFVGTHAEYDKRKF